MTQHHRFTHAAAASLAAILLEHETGTRACPDEDIQEIADANDEGLALYRQLTGLAGSGQASAR